MTRLIKPVDFRFKTAPFAHQEKAFYLSRDKEYFGLLMEQGTGKTKVIIDTAAWLYGQGEIDGVLVIAPNGVHRNWIKREIPIHFPEEIPHRLYLWSATECRSKKAQKDLQSFLLENRKLTFLAMNTEVFSVSTGMDLAEKYLKSGHRLVVIDESTRIKNPGAKRTKNILRLRKKAPYRRIMTGTPVTNSPLDLFAQFKFLDPEILGFTSYYTFKHYYAIWRSESTKAGQDYEMLLNYTNLEELKESISPWSYRVTKAECLDLPDKIYQSILVQLSPEQKKLYKQLAEEFVIQFKGQEISAPIVITRLMRFQQIVGGFLPVDAGFIDENFEETFDFTTAPIPGGNPKLDALKGVVEDYPGKMIIWSRFRPEIAMIAKFLKEEFGHESVVEYHGGVPPKNRGPAVDAFEDMESPVRFFVGQPRSGGIGLNLIAASTVVYFSNEFSAETRWQSEDRCHRIGQEKSVVYIDIEMVGTVDETIRKSLKANKNLADYINDDQIGMGEILWGEST